MAPPRDDNYDFWLGWRSFWEEDCDEESWLPRETWCGFWGEGCWGIRPDDEEDGKFYAAAYEFCYCALSGESGASSSLYRSIDLRLMPIGNIYEWNSRAWDTLLCIMRVNRQPDVYSSRLSSLASRNVINYFLRSFSTTLPSVSTWDCDSYHAKSAAALPLPPSGKLCASLLPLFGSKL